MKWDVFISHASEDKEEFVRPLADSLSEKGLRVWYDEHALYLGDSIRRGIERGLSNSQFGIVVLSPAFLQKEWPQKELDFLIAAETDGDHRILPIWHNLTAEDVRARSPLLADRIAVSTNNGSECVAQPVVSTIRAAKHSVDSHFKRCANQHKADVNGYVQYLYDKIMDLTVSTSDALENVRILFVDDEDRAQRYFSMMFRSEGALVYTAGNGMEALEFLKENTCDVLITDIRMPGMDGQELLARVHELDPDMPLIATTAFSDYPREGFPCAGWITKPWDVDELKRCILDVLNPSGLYRFSKLCFRDCAETYLRLFDVQRIIRSFGKRYQSEKLFETALRHKIKDSVHDFCMNVHVAKYGGKLARHLYRRVSRLETLMGQIQHGSELGLRNLLNGVADDVQAERPLLTINVSSPQRLPSNIAGSDLEGFLGLCVLEFIDNALDEIHGNAEIRIILRNRITAKALFLAVCNTGSEVPANLVQTLFDEGVSTKGPGRGMGLSVIRSIGKRFGAQVFFEQTGDQTGSPGHHSRNIVQFSVVVPLSGGQSA